MYNYAPVLIPTLNRHVHFKRCVESLSACTHADKTDLFIFLDYPLKDTHWEGYELIKAYLPSIKGFKTVNVIEREKNYGAVDNFFKSLEYVFERHDRLIFSEDDNEFSPNFLEYINKGLDIFEYDPNVVAICGYNYPIVIPNDYIQNYYYYKAFSAWGFGAWKDKSLKFNCNHYEIPRLIKNKNYIKESIRYYQFANLEYVLRSIIQEKNLFGDGAITVNMIKNNKYGVFPTISKVINYGHDGSGVNCGTSIDDVFLKQKIDRDNKFIYSERAPLKDKHIIKKLRHYISLNYKEQVKFFIMCLIYIPKLLIRKKFNFL